VWEVLNDIELIAPYVPGFQLREAADDVYRGTMKVKLGAMTVEYQAEITIAERARDTMTVQMLVLGRERRGAGKVKATVTSRLESRGHATVIVLNTDVDLVGKVAQMGRGMIADVSNKLVGDFVRSLEENILKAESVDPQAEDWSPPSISRRPDLQGASASSRARPSRGDAVDITAVASRSLSKRFVGPSILILLALALLLRRRRG
jgi:hypothetical protein